MTSSNRLRAFVDRYSEELEEMDEKPLVLMDGYDDCIVGIVRRFGSEPFVVYDVSKVLAKLVAEGMTQEEAGEFHEFNQAGAWVGANTPGFIVLPEAADE